jgi:DNA (cytosine-5)-methyltransferase 1
MDLLRKHLDLFSGIGGFALAARWAGIETIGFCEIDKYAQKVLEKNFPGVPIYEDVTKLDGSEFKDIFLITGGFPCQDISIAGKGAGIEGERSGLWSELFRIIGEVRPKYALIENVPALTFRGGTRVIADLTEIGYDTEWQIVGADDVGAPHRRKRIWIVAYPNGSTDKSQVTGDVAYSNSGLSNRKKEEICTGGNSADNGSEDVAYSSNKRIRTCQRGAIPESIQENDARGDNQRGNGSDDSNETRKSSLIRKDAEDVAHSQENDTNSNGKRLHRKGKYKQGEVKPIDREVSESGPVRKILAYKGRSGKRDSKDVAYSNSKRGCSRETNREDAEDVRESSRCEKHGYWVTEPSVGRVVNGLPHRVDRLKGLGNAIVPQVAYEIMKLLK